MHVKKYMSRKVFVRNYKKYDKEEFKASLRNVAWENCLSQTTMNAAWDSFKDYVIRVIKAHAPKLERKVRGDDNPWMTKDVKSKMNTRDYHLRKAKRTNAEVDWSAYKRTRNIVTNTIRHAKSNHVQNLFTENNNSPKHFWNRIKKCYSAKENENPRRCFKDDKIVTDKNCISNTFCSFFSTIGSDLSKKIPIFSLSSA